MKLLYLLLTICVLIIKIIAQEWYFGNFLCKFSVWINGTAVCASVYTLVAVSADRYFAICHTMKYSTLEPMKTLVVIIPIWLISGILFLPDFIYFNQIIWTGEDGDAIPVKICIPQFPSMDAHRMYFIMVYFSLAFIIPLVAITACYIYIFAAIVRRPTFAVDKNAQARDQRVKLKVTHMMVTVVILFAASWLPFYCFFAYIMFNQDDALQQAGVQLLRAMLQWLVLANSCINPILYAYFSRKFLRAFREILVLPCRKRYNQLKSYTKSTRHRTARIRSQISETVMSRVSMINRRDTDFAASRNSSCWANEESSVANANCNNNNNKSMENHSLEINRSKPDLTGSSANSTERVKRRLIDTALLVRSRLEDEIMHGNMAPMNSRMSIQMAERPVLIKSRSSCSSLFEKTGSRPVIRNSEIISESSSEEEMLEPGMIALSLVTLPCLLTTGRRSNDSSALMGSNGILPNKLRETVDDSDEAELTSKASQISRRTSVPTNL